MTLEDEAQWNATREPDTSGAWVFVSAIGQIEQMLRRQLAVEVLPTERRELPARPSSRGSRRAIA